MSNKGVDDVMGHQAEPVIKAWVRQHEANQKNGTALTDAVKTGGIKPADIERQREEGNDIQR